MTSRKSVTTMPEILITVKDSEADAMGAFAAIAEVIEDIQQTTCYPGFPDKGTWERVARSGVVVWVALS